MGVLNTDLGKQLETTTLGARLWRLQPGQASTRHRHAVQEELYVVLEGTGRIRVDGGEPLTWIASARWSSSHGPRGRCSTTRPRMRCGWWWGRPGGGKYARDEPG